MEASTLVDEKVIEASASVIALVAHGPMDHGRREVDDGGRKVVRCELYPNLECAEHERNSEVLLKYFTGHFRLPHMVFCDGDGKELFRKPGYRRPDEMRRDFQDALAKLPGKRLTRAEYLPHAAALEAGLAAAASAKWKDAAEKLAPLAKSAPENLRAKAAETLATIKAYGDEMLRGARDLVAVKRPDDARPLLKDLAENFPSFECGKEAAELLKKLDEKK